MLSQLLQLPDARERVQTEATTWTVHLATLERYALAHWVEIDTEGLDWTGHMAIAFYECWQAASFLAARYDRLSAQPDQVYRLGDFLKTRKISEHRWYAIQVAFEYLDKGGEAEPLIDSKARNCAAQLFTGLPFDAAEPLSRSIVYEGLQVASDNALRPTRALLGRRFMKSLMTESESMIDLFSPTTRRAAETAFEGPKSGNVLHMAPSI